MTQKTSKESVWNHLSWYYLACCILVCVVHFSNTASIFNSAPIPWFDQLQHIHINYFGAPIVAGFFIISGFLFFRNFQWSQLFSKWKRRIKSLLIPYLAWNTLYALYAFIMANNPFLRRFADFKEVSIQDFFQGIINCFLYNPVFWYMAYLMLFALLAPIFYLLARNTIVAAVTFLLLCLIQSSLLIQWFSHSSVYIFWSTFFFIGAYLALHAPVRRFLAAPPPWVCVLTAILYLISLYLYQTNISSLFYLLYYGMLAYSLWLLTGLIRIPAITLTSCTFFLYGAHQIISRNIYKLVCVTFNTDAIYGLISWCIMPFLIFGIALFCKSLSRYRWFCPIWTVLNGGR